MTFKNTAAAALMALTLTGAAGATAQLDSVLTAASQATGSQGSVVQPVLMEYTRLVTPADVASFAAENVHVTRLLEGGRACLATIPNNLLVHVSTYGDITDMSYDAPVHASLDVTEHAILDPSTPFRGTFRNTLGLDGSGVNVAVLDSGVARVPGLAATSVVYAPPVKSGRTSAVSGDDYGHGTHVAGIIGGWSAVRGQPMVQGIAPGAHLLDLRVLNAQGEGTTSDVIAAIDWCVTNRAAGVNVINLSLSHPPYESYTTDPLCRAVERAYRAGITVVCSAGNWGRYGYGTIGSPGNDPFVITVGAANAHKTYERSDDTVTTYSSRGPSIGDHILKPDILAPGNKVISWASPNSTLYNTPGIVLSGNPGSGRYPYMELSGTSMAAPVVAGIVALMKQQNRAATPDEIKARLMASAQKLTDDAFAQGAGYVNVNAALAARTNGSRIVAASPRVDVDANGVASLVDPVTGNASVWGDQLRGGSAAAIWGSMNTFADSAVWGDRALWGDRAIWGDRVLWGNAVVGADSVLQHGDE